MRPIGARTAIVNADDFGQSLGINQGIIQAHEHGIVTSASLMVRWPAAVAAAAYAREHPGLDLGLHLDLGEWIYRNKAWEVRYEVVPPGNAARVRDEIARQLDRFHALVGKAPTHLDSHQHVHREEPVRSLLGETAARLKVPLRDFDPRVRFCGDFYGQMDKGAPCPECIRPENLIRILMELPAGITEVSCHPGLGAEADAMYSSERPRELEALCDARVRAVLAADGIRLGSFAELTRTP